MSPLEIKRRFPQSSASTLKVNTIHVLDESVVPTCLVPVRADEEKLNKTERAYLAYLTHLRVSCLGIQNITLKIADDCRFTPDFNYVTGGGLLTFVDVKGFQREDALIKIKVAARMFPQFRFHIVKKAGAGWDVTEIRS